MSVRTSSYEPLIKRLVESHRKLRRTGKLLFAGWYDRDNERGDVCLLEVYEDFPDPGLGRLETFPFPSSSEFPVKGSLRLTVTSPSELKEAAARDDATLRSIMSSSDRQVIYPAEADWQSAIKEWIE